MGHRPYPNADRARRYVDARHGSSCPRCGHRASVHPYKHGQFVCRRSRDGMPSCRECSARLMRLRAGPLRGLVESGAQLHITMPAIQVMPPSRALAVRSVQELLLQARPRRA
jgi:transposase-like protein